MSEGKKKKKQDAYHDADIDEREPETEGNKTRNGEAEDSDEEAVVSQVNWNNANDPQKSNNMR